MKLFVKILAGIIIIAVLVVGGFSFYMTRGLKSGETLAVGHIKASNLEDGVYAGKYDGGRWSNEVNVAIEDSKITKIDIVKSVLFERAEMTKELFDRVIQKQDTDVDAVTGATVTSKAYLKSIENALTK